MRMVFLPALILCVSCAPFPTLDGTISDTARQAPYPRLAPLPATVPETVPSGTDAILTARVAALNARADRLRRQDIAALQ